MSTVLMVVVVVVVVVVVAGAGFVVWRQARTQRLRRQFGPEYDRAMESHQNRREAERELQEREQRHQELDIRPLDPQARDLYQQQWTHVQEHFVDAPEAAVEQGDRLVIVVMAERGYPTEDFEDRLASLSVKHARMLDHYRRGHQIGQSASRKEASTEELRQAMVHYRALFEDLLAAPAQDTVTATADHRPGTADEPVDPVGPEVTAGQAQRERADDGTVTAAQAGEPATGELDGREPVGEDLQDRGVRTDHAGAVPADHRERSPRSGPN